MREEGRRKRTRTEAEEYNIFAHVMDKLYRKLSDGGGRETNTGGEAW